MPVSPNDSPRVPPRMPLLVTVCVLAVALPMTTPDDNTPRPVPRRVGSIRPLLVSVSLEPVSVIALPPTPRSTPTLPLGFTVTFRLLEPLAKFGASGLAAPLQVTLLPAVVHAAWAGKKLVANRASAAPATVVDTLRLPQDRVVSGTATQLPVAAFQRLLKAMFMGMSRCLVDG